MSFSFRTLPVDFLENYISSQLRNFFPDGASSQPLHDHLPEALKRLEFCFSHIASKYFRRNGEVIFNYLHSDQYAMLLYVLSNTIHKYLPDHYVCEKLFYLNKALNGLDCFYSIKLPDIFLFCHPVGTVLGRATYSDFFLVYQGCTVGANHENEYPVLGVNVAMYKSASVLGQCTIGNNCKISADSTVISEDVPADSLYFGRKGNSQLRSCAGNPPKIWDPVMLQNYLATKANG